MNIKSEQEMLSFGATFARQLLKSGRTDAIIELTGDVGAGKTTFTRGLAKGLGITAPVTSPSFTISKSYAFPGGHTLTHYDFYRLDRPGLMLDDLRDAIKSHHLIIVEWGNSLENFLPKDRVQIVFTTNNDNSREVTIKHPSSAPASWSAAGGAPGGDPKKIQQISVSKGQEQAHSRPFATNEEQHERLSPVTTGAKERVENGPVLSFVTLFLDTSTPITFLKLNNKEYRHEFGNTLSQNLLSFIHDKLEENHFDWHDIRQITFMSGPGSFTGLRIGASVVNTLAHELNIPLYDHRGKKHPIILPDYGRPANITAPQK